MNRSAGAACECVRGNGQAPHDRFTLLSFMLSHKITEAKDSYQMNYPVSVNVTLVMLHAGFLSLPVVQTRWT